MLKNKLKIPNFVRRKKDGWIDKKINNRHIHPAFSQYLGVDGFTLMLEISVMINKRHPHYETMPPNYNSIWNSLTLK